MSYTISSDIFYLIACELSPATLVQLFACCKKLYSYHRHAVLFRHLLAQRYEVYLPHTVLDQDLFAQRNCLTLLQRMHETVHVCSIREHREPEHRDPEHRDPEHFTFTLRPPFYPGAYSFIPHRLPHIYGSTNYKCIIDLFGTVYIRDGNRFFPLLNSVQSVKILANQLLILDQAGHLVFHTLEDEPRDYHHVLAYFTYTDIEVGSYTVGGHNHYFYCALDKSGELWMWQYRDIIFPTRIPTNLKIRQVQVNFGVKFDDKNHERYLYLVDTKDNMYVLTLYPEKILRSVPLDVRSLTIFDRDQLAVITPDRRLCLIKNMRGYIAVTEQPFTNVSKVVRYRSRDLLLLLDDGRVYYYHNDVMPSKSQWHHLVGIYARDICSSGDQFHVLGSV